MSWRRLRRAENRSRAHLEGGGGGYSAAASKSRRPPVDVFWVQFGLLLRRLIPDPSVQGSHIHASRLSFEF